MSRVKEYFKEFPASDKCFEATDGTLFHEEGDANLYQKSIDKNAKVKAHFKSSVVATAQNADAAATSAAINSPKQKAGKKVTDEIKKEGGQPDVVNELLEAGLQNATVETVDGKTTDDAANAADIKVEEVATQTETKAVAKKEAPVKKTAAKKAK